MEVNPDSQDGIDQYFENRRITNGIVSRKCNKPVQLEDWEDMLDRTKKAIARHLASLDVVPSHACIYGRMYRVRFSPDGRKIILVPEGPARSSEQHKRPAG